MCSVRGVSVCVVSGVSQCVVSGVSQCVVSGVSQCVVSGVSQCLCSVRGVSVCSVRGVCMVSGVCVWCWGVSVCSVRGVCVVSGGVLVFILSGVQVVWCLPEVWHSAHRLCAGFQQGSILAELYTFCGNLAYFGSLSDYNLVKKKQIEGLGE